jgi:hypothetical protein
MTKTYAEKLKDPRWQRKRLEVFSRDNFRCRICQDHERTLHLHHIKYTTKDPWDEPDSNLRTICERCHSEVHNKESIKIMKDYMELIADQACPYTMLFMFDSLRIKIKTAQAMTSQELKASCL